MGGYIASLEQFFVQFKVLVGHMSYFHLPLFINLHPIYWVYRPGKMQFWKCKLLSLIVICRSFSPIIIFILQSPKVDSYSWDCYTNNHYHRNRWFEKCTSISQIVANYPTTLKPAVGMQEMYTNFPNGPGPFGCKSQSNLLWSCADCIKSREFCIQQSQSFWEVFI